MYNVIVGQYELMVNGSYMNPKTNVYEKEMQQCDETLKGKYDQCHTFYWGDIGDILKIAKMKLLLAIIHSFIHSMVES